MRKEYSAIIRCICIIHLCQLQWLLIKNVAINVSLFCKKTMKLTDMVKGIHSSLLDNSDISIDLNDGISNIAI